eukprot:4945758-Pyramimonas_sp.AAC.1
MANAASSACAVAARSNSSASASAPAIGRVAQAMGCDWPHPSAAIGRIAEATGCDPNPTPRHQAVSCTPAGAAAAPACLCSAR